MLDQVVPKVPDTEERSIAYFSMEIALESNIPTYCGGLGILAGDTIRSAADHKVPMVAVTLIYRNGYFYQSIDASGMQIEKPFEWVVENYLQDTGISTTITLENRKVHIKAWRYYVKGVTGFSIPVYLLDSDLPENSATDRTLTNSLYGGDQKYRLMQEAIIGIAGVKILRLLGYNQIQRFHMNEGHASFLTLELLDEYLVENKKTTATKEDLEVIRKCCVFTTHTPVDAAHDMHPTEIVSQVLGQYQAFNLKNSFCTNGKVNMTYLGFNLSSFINGVAKRHGEVSREMFANYSIDSITNGVHAATWTSPSIQKLFDQYIPGWREDNFSLRYAISIPGEKLWQAHLEAKRELLALVYKQTNVHMDQEIFTIGFARRSTAYKRSDLLFWDIERLKQIKNQVGKFQLIYAGKAHPRDNVGKELIRKIFQLKETLKDDFDIVYLENYNMDLAKKIVSGVDIWLNTPQPPLEASGTSGMKAALNGIPSLSVLDGWWIEGCIEGETGWAIAPENATSIGTHDTVAEAISLYNKLESVILPMFYHHREKYIEVMRSSIALNGSFFNTQRMIQEYVLKAYI